MHPVGFMIVRRSMINELVKVFKNLAYFVSRLIHINLSNNDFGYRNYSFVSRTIIPLLFFHERKRRTPEDSFAGSRSHLDQAEIRVFQHACQPLYRRLSQPKDKYKERNVGNIDENGKVVTAPRNIYTKPTHSGNCKSSYFSLEKSVYEGDLYLNPGKHDLVEALKKSKVFEDK